MFLHYPLQTWRHQPQPWWGCGFRREPPWRKKSRVPRIEPWWVPPAGREGFVKGTKERRSGLKGTMTDSWRSRKPRVQKLLGRPSPTPAVLTLVLLEGGLWGSGKNGPRKQVRLEVSLQRRKRKMMSNSSLRTFPAVSSLWGEPQDNWGSLPPSYLVAGCWPLPRRTTVLPLVYRHGSLNPEPQAWLWPLSPPLQNNWILLGPVPIPPLYSLWAEVLPGRAQPAGTSLPRPGLPRAWWKNELPLASSRACLLRTSVFQTMWFSCLQSPLPGMLLSSQHASHLSTLPEWRNGGEIIWS